jgi:hypothetical protein
MIKRIDAPRIILGASRKRNSVTSHTGFQISGYAMAAEKATFTHLGKAIG